MINLLRLLFWLAPPSPLKNRILSVLGHRIEPGARLSPCVVWKVRDFRVADGGMVRPLSVFKNLERVEIGRDALLGPFNLVSAHPVFAAVGLDAGCLLLDDGAFITSRHSIDCSGSVRLGRFSAIAGHGTTVLTHSIDLDEDAQAARPVAIGEYSFVGTNCLLLGGASVPARSVLAAGAVLPKDIDGPREPGVWAGVPARRVSDVPPDAAWFHRTSPATRDVIDPVSGMRRARAF